MLHIQQPQGLTHPVTVTEVHVQVGDRVVVGRRIVTILDDAGVSGGITAPEVGIIASVVAEGQSLSTDEAVAVLNMDTKVSSSPKASVATLKPRSRTSKRGDPKQRNSARPHRKAKGQPAHQSDEGEDSLLSGLIVILAILMIPTCGWFWFQTGEMNPAKWLAYVQGDVSDDNDYIPPAPVTEDDWVDRTATDHSRFGVGVAGYGSRLNLRSSVTGYPQNDLSLLGRGNYHYARVEGNKLDLLSTSLSDRTYIERWSTLAFEWSRESHVELNGQTDVTWVGLHRKPGGSSFAIGLHQSGDILVGDESGVRNVTTGQAQISSVEHFTFQNYVNKAVVLAWDTAGNISMVELDGRGTISRFHLFTIGNDTVFGVKSLAEGMVGVLTHSNASASLHIINTTGGNFEVEDTITLPSPEGRQLLLADVVLTQDDEIVLVGDIRRAIDRGNGEIIQQSQIYVGGWVKETGVWTEGRNAYVFREEVAPQDWADTHISLIPRGITRYSDGFALNYDYRSISVSSDRDDYFSSGIALFDENLSYGLQYRRFERNPLYFRNSGTVEFDDQLFIYGKYNYSSIYVMSQPERYPATFSYGGWFQVYE